MPPDFDHMHVGLAFCRARGRVAPLPGTRMPEIERRRISRKARRMGGGKRSASRLDAPPPLEGRSAPKAKGLRRLLSGGEERSTIGAELVPTTGRGSTGDLASDSARRLQELWLMLARLRWQALVVVPAHSRGSTRDFARSLAAVGNELGGTPVASASLDEIDAGAARSLASLVHQARERRDWPSSEVDPDDLLDRASFSSDEPPLPFGKLVIGVPPVVSNPVGLGITDAADFILLGIELGRTTTAEVRRSIEMIGRERIAGCVLI